MLTGASVLPDSSMNSLPTIVGPLFVLKYHSTFHPSAYRSTGPEASIPFSESSSFVRADDPGVAETGWL